MFFDDILTTGQSQVEHLNRLKKVLKCLDESGLKIKKEKFLSFKNEISYLGYTNMIKKG